MEFLVKISSNYIKDHPCISFVFTFLCICLFQIFSSFYGVDVMDTGYFMTGYEQIFEASTGAPEMIGLYLTNVMGGVIMKLYPPLGIWGFRIIGIILLDLTFLIIFWTLRNEIPLVHLIIGCVIIVLGLAKSPCFFGAGLFTCSLYVIFVLLLYKGLTKKNKALIFISGIIVGLNVFVRIPNILAIIVVLIVLLNRWIINGDKRCDWCIAVLFLLGLIVGCLCVLLLIYLLGHQQMIIELIMNLISLGNSETGGHSWSLLLVAQFYTYSQAVIFLCLFYTIFAIDSKISDKKNIYIAASFFLVASFVIVYHVYLSFSFNPIWALCFAGSIIGLREYGNTRLLSVLSLFMLLVEPFGSNSGYNQGCLPAILAAPIASSFVINKKNVKYVIIACLALGLQYIKQGCYGDIGPIYEKNSLLNVPELAYMRTTKGKAEVINSSLLKLRSLIAPNETLIVYDAVPLLNYLTHTRPVNGQPWPAAGSSVTIDMSTCVTPPKILIQKFDDISNPLPATRGIPTGNQMLDTYMKEHHYGIVYENPYFILLFPYHE